MIQCLICDQRDAGHYFACTACVRGIQRQLRELEDYFVILGVLTVPGRSGRGGTRSPGYGSRPPASDDILTALDPRSGAGAAVFRLHDPRDQDDQPIRSIPGSIHGIACWLREQHELTHPRVWTVRSEIVYVLGKVDWCACFDWVTEFADDIRELHSQARALANDSPPRPLGRCLAVGCDSTVWPATLTDPDGHSHDGGRCAVCHRTYSGLDMVRLHAAQEAS